MDYGSNFAYWAYLGIASLGFLASIGILGFKRIFDFRRIASIYLIFMFITYFVRPLLEHGIFQDPTFFQHIDEHYEPVMFSDATLIFFGIFVAITLVVFSITYRIHSPKTLDGICVTSSYPAKKLVQLAYWTIIGIGYFGFLLGGMFRGEMIGTAQGTGFVGTSGYIFLLNYLVVAGVSLRYMVTSKFISCAIISAPWALVHLANGYNRFIVITLLMGFFGVWLIRGGKVKFRHVMVTLVAAPLLLFVFNILSTNRKAFTDMRMLESAIESVLEEPVYNSLHGFAGFEGSLITLDRMQKELDYPYYGTNLIYRTVIWPIPRALWWGKPYPPEFHWNYILSLGEDRTLTHGYTKLFSTWFVRGGIGKDIKEWGIYLFWVNPLWVGLLAGYIEKRCLVPQGHPILYIFYFMFFASFTYIGRSTLYDNLGPLAFALYFPLLAAYFLTAYSKGFRQGSFLKFRYQRFFRP